MNLDKEWELKEKTLEKTRKEKAKAAALALGIQAIQYLDNLNRLDVPDKKQAEEKWNRMSHKKKSTMIYLFDKYTQEEKHPI